MAGRITVKGSTSNDEFAHGHPNPIPQLLVSSLYNTFQSFETCCCFHTGRLSSSKKHQTTYGENPMKRCAVQQISALTQNASLVAWNVFCEDIVADAWRTCGGRVADAWRRNDWLNRFQAPPPIPQNIIWRVMALWRFKKQQRP